jgi:signal transduction histidine kinase
VAAKALAAGADSTLVEPFYPGELTSILSRALARAVVPVAAALAEPLAPPPAAPAAAAPAPAEAAPDGASRRVERLAAGVAHSIRNPLQILELQLETVEGDDGVDVSAIRAELRRIAGVVEGLTRYGGHKRLNLAPADLSNLLTGVFVSRDVGAAGAEIGLRIGEARVEILADADLFRAGLEAVRNRAVRVTPLEGRISVRTRVRAEGDARTVEISVTDGGPALSADELAHVFDPYPDDSTLQDGTGLDLAAMSGIVRDHGGSVQALAAGETGTSILIRLPVRDG